MSPLAVADAEVRLLTAVRESERELVAGIYLREETLT
jgi:hypothetical protein